MSADKSIVGCWEGVRTSAALVSPRGDFLAFLNALGRAGTVVSRRSHASCTLPPRLSARFHRSSTRKNPYRGALTANSRHPRSGRRELKGAVLPLIFRGGRLTQVPYLFSNVRKFAVFRGKTGFFAGLIFHRFHGASTAQSGPKSKFLSWRVLWAQSCHSLFTTVPRPFQARRTP
jgi:hypothetical protein